MWSSKFWKFLAVSFLSLFLLPAITPAQHYKQTNLVSDVPGIAPVTDPNLINPWGLSRSNGSPWWISDNNSGFTSLYTGAGVSVPINGTGTVIIPPPKNAPPGATATPTGTVFNGSSDFLLPNGKPARFIFATEDGTISGWNGGTSAVLMVDNSDNGSPNGAVYKGATTAATQSNAVVMTKRSSISTPTSRTPMQRLAAWRARLAQRYHIPGFPTRKDW